MVRVREECVKRERDGEKEGMCASVRRTIYHFQPVPSKMSRPTLQARPLATLASAAITPLLHKQSGRPASSSRATTHRTSLVVIAFDHIHQETFAKCVKRLSRSFFFARITYWPLGVKMPSLVDAKLPSLVDALMYPWQSCTSACPLIRLLFSKSLM